MGSSESTPNHQVEGSCKEVNSNIETQCNQLRKTTYRNYKVSKNGDRNHNGQQNTSSGDLERPIPTLSNSINSNFLDSQFKVLPKVNESLNLRVTENGAILSSGGTISGRRSKPMYLKDNTAMRRSSALIHASEKSSTARCFLSPTFARSQTMMHINVNTKEFDPKKQNNISNLHLMKRQTYSEPELKEKCINDCKVDTRNVLASMGKTNKQNKYNKKRRAPEAPVVINSGMVSGISISICDQLSSRQRPQLYTKNADRGKTHITKTVDKLIPTQNSNNIIQRNTAELKPNRKIENHLNDYDPSTFRQANSSRRNWTFNHFHPEKLDNCSAVDKLNSSYDQSIEPNSIPKIKRRFYYGMDVHTPTTEQVDDIAQFQSVQNSNFTSIVKKNVYNEDEASFFPQCKSNFYKLIRIEENIDDNGLLVRIRPTLPRRPQVDLLSFSPELAWHNLLEIDGLTINKNTYNNLNKNLSDITQSNINKGIFNNLNEELPIRPRRMVQIFKIPKLYNSKRSVAQEKDFGDKNDETNQALTAEYDSSSDESRSKECDGLLLFGKKSQELSRDSSFMSPVRLISISLPKNCKIHYDRDCFQTGNICDYESLQKSNQENLDNIYINSFDYNNNWMLHKSDQNMDVHGNSKRPIETLGNLSKELQTIKMLKGGNYAIYLPGNSEHLTSSLQYFRSKLGGTYK
ncbi:uncharacterized protein LOC115633471 isoform X2 [Scaptodrosophila lebanonensis]|uniref:Uncharacterized protein LOC115633471 isoform X2 n=1 Tax=Drosophila lebanonensis TaxID=7225 RepID=A0A6J2UF79_DROLE|nr:uncharacterized protein LOC115633471 isoform X2 [Scaptodrosophila lebanonensis]XP_030386791.1 uncharacterized protein LOC115633471 isoform X3 [Scaptodrosophila lebanonensis]XP_030386792.1 uncharacterized protein LOC115633471 isoform X2 [Scaptodrosophila lebanonensis]